MNLFFDTSALVKFFHEEEGTDIVTELILDRNNEVWISELGRLEFVSAVFSERGDVRAEHALPKISKPSYLVLSVSTICLTYYFLGYYPQIQYKSSRADL